LIPEEKDQEILERLFYDDDASLIDSTFLERAIKWRGIRLPAEGLKAGQAIIKLKETRVLETMVNFSDYARDRELKSDGVRRFWKRLAKESRSQCSFLLELR
jgi:hypothetical protein